MTLEKTVVELEPHKHVFQALVAETVVCGLEELKDIGGRVFLEHLVDKKKGYRHPNHVAFLVAVTVGGEVGVDVDDASVKLLAFMGFPDLLY